MSLERDFEKFAAGPLESEDKRLHVTMRRKGVIYLNGNVHRLLGKPEAVSLFFSRERETIAICPADVRRRESFPLVKQANGWRIRSSPFFRHYEIKVSTTQRFIRPEYTADGYLLLELRQTINSPARRPKIKAQKFMR